MCVKPISEMNGAKKIAFDDFAGGDLTTDVSSTSSSSSDDESEPETSSDDLSPQIFTIERYDITTGKYLTTICRFSLVLIGDNPLTEDKSFENLEWIILRFGGLIENRFKYHGGAIELLPDVNNKLRISPPPSGVDIPILVTPYDPTPCQKEVINQFQRGINRDLFNSTFLFDSQRLNSIPDLSKYRIGDSIYADYNPNEILLGDIKWSSLSLKVNSSPCKLEAPEEDGPNSNYAKSQSQMKSSNEELSDEIRRVLNLPNTLEEPEDFEIVDSEVNGSSLLEDEDEDLYGEVAAEASKPPPSSAPQQVGSKAPQPSTSKQVPPKASTSKETFKSLHKTRQKSKTPSKEPILLGSDDDDSDSDFEPEIVKVTKSKGKNLKAPHLMPVPRTRRDYSTAHSQTLLNYICKKKLHLQIKGETIWKDMERMKEPFADRTWQSMKEHFLKQIYPVEKMDGLNIKEGDRKMFEKLRKRFIKRRKKKN